MRMLYFSSFLMLIMALLGVGVSAKTIYENNGDWEWIANAPYGNSSEKIFYDRSSPKKSGNSLVDLVFSAQIQPENYVPGKGMVPFDVAFYSVEVNCGQGNTADRSMRFLETKYFYRGVLRATDTPDKQVWIKIWTGSPMASMSAEACRAVSLSTAPAQATQAAQPISCANVKFFKDLGPESKVFMPIDLNGDPSRTPAGMATVKLFDSSMPANAKLPVWLNPIDGWLTPALNDPPTLGDSCARWNGADWYVRGVTKPHDAPGGAGFIALDLTHRKAYLKIAQDTPQGKRTAKAVGEPSLLEGIQAAFGL
ncbi:hypothetical protein FOZ70_14055 [Burkholderia sp. COPS]|uniref:hypothetical protein n=1 Tax=Burkholderia sp. COPS TaxID=2597663 RepID=UPI001CA56632|nr:hypothetical protein [Burkholderia sp. COPS]MBW5805867.1 hypothetical protein [Burkholderia sp. COPS]